MKLVLSFAAPLLFGMLFQQFYSFVDTAVVGRYLGAVKLAAVGATGSVNFLVIGLCLGFCSGFAIPIAQAFGAKDEGEVRKNVWHAAVLSAVLSIIFGLAATLGCKPLLRLMNTPEEILEDSASYIRIIFAAIPFCVLYNMASGILRSLGDSRTPVVFLILASLVNIVLDLFLIIVCGMDVAGAAVATAVSQLLSGIGCVVVIIRRFPILRLTKEDRELSPKRARSMLGIGLPMGLQFSITAIGSVTVQWSVNGLGVDAVAAVSAASKLSMFFACVFDALASTMATFAGQNVGARKLNRVGQGLKAASILGTVYCVIAWGVVRQAAGAVYRRGRERRRAGPGIPVPEDPVVLLHSPAVCEHCAAEHPGHGLYPGGHGGGPVRNGGPGVGGPAAGTLRRFYRGQLRQPGRLGAGGSVPVPLLLPADAGHAAEAHAGTGGKGIRLIPAPRPWRLPGRR